jgi:hypothetical protein
MRAMINGSVSLRDSSNSLRACSLNILFHGLPEGSIHVMCRVVENVPIIVVSKPLQRKMFPLRTQR